MKIRKFDGVPIFEPNIYRTAYGTPYLSEVGAAMVAQTTVDMEGFRPFLESFGDDLGFDAYLDDPDDLADADQIAKAGGQLCYLSFGPKRSRNADASRYFDNIKRQGHGSVLEHAAFSILFWGVDRTLTHELVRHRVMSFSQVSQRYVGGETLRFVMRPEFYGHGAREVAARLEFCHLIDAARRRYVETVERLADGETTTAARKKIRQAARYCLPGCAEAPILVSGNARAWRNFIDQRASEHADTPIRDAAVKALTILQAAAPLIFGDYRVVALADGTKAAESDYRKV